MKPQGSLTVDEITVPSSSRIAAGVRGYGKTGRICQLAVLLMWLVTLAFPAPLQAQRVETQGAQSPAITAGGNVAVTYGLTPEQVQELTKAAAAGAVGPLADKIVDLSNRLGVTQGAALSVLRITGQQDVPLEKLPQKLAEVAEQYKSAVERLATLDPQDPVTRDLVARADDAIKTGHLDEADQLVSQAEQVELTAARQAQQLAQQARAAADQRLLRAAADRGVRGDIAMTQLHYLDAARHFQKATDLVPTGHPDDKGRFLLAQADALMRQGYEHGANADLGKAIATYQSALKEWTHDRVPHSWAAVQVRLGYALKVLGERESGTENLQQAVEAFRLALEEDTRDRVPLYWAGTQRVLGDALERLGEREPGTEHLKQAVEAYRLALEESTRDRVPLEWAAAQVSLGGTLKVLGERESGTEHLQQAVEAFRLALEEDTRDRVPLYWAATQRGLGDALVRLGEREPGTEHLQRAVEAYRLALEESTRDRVPLDWAAAQMGLGGALKVLGERESGTEHLQQAVEAFRLALEEDTRDRVPLYWAATQRGLGDALERLGEREPGTEHLQQAVEAYRLALEESTRERVPLEWASTQLNMGLALVALGKRTHNIGSLKEALICFQQARPIFWAAGMAQSSEASDRMVGRLQDELANSAATPSRPSKPGD
jgi:tetratricopeptide (TPR) repeat protein